MFSNDLQYGAPVGGGGSAEHLGLLEMAGNASEIIRYYNELRPMLSALGLAWDTTLPAKDLRSPAASLFNDPAGEYAFRQRFLFI